MERNALLNPKKNGILISVEARKPLRSFLARSKIFQCTSTLHPKIFIQLFLFITENDGCNTLLIEDVIVSMFVPSEHDY